MSDSMAFLAGAAFAGIAAILLSRGGGNALQNFPPPNALPTPPPIQQTTPLPLPQPQPQPLPPSAPTPNPLVEQQRLDIERLKTQLEQQKNDAEFLKEQLRTQQSTLEAMRSQLALNQATPNITPLPQSQLVNNQLQPSGSNLLSAILWAGAGVILTVIIGIIILIAFALFSQQRANRTVQVIQPAPYPPALPPRRRQQFQPPRIRDRDRFDEDYD